MLQISSEVYDLASSGDLDDLKKALQFAIELEHATMPVYLYASYSVGLSVTNFEINKCLREISKEEMHHMLLAGNLLKAIGGSPAIDSPDFVPDYPANLPGTIATELNVPLAPFSKSHVEDVFMRIERPVGTLEFPIVARKMSLAPSKTIGEFYGRIRKGFIDGGEALIVDKTGETQPSHPSLPPGLQKVTSTAEAVAAIDLIVEQGEGTASEPTFPDGDGNPNNDDLAHYYKLAEIVRGRLKKTPEAMPETPPHQRYFYDAADPVPFAANEVLPMPTNPKAAHYEPDSEARIAVDAFNQTYTDVLRKLDAAFNGTPDAMFGAVDDMNGMGVMASRILRVELDDGTRPGPTFEYFQGGEAA